MNPKPVLTSSVDDIKTVQKLDDDGLKTTPRRVAVLQSNYIPWLGYFDLIHDVDIFIFYDDVQFTKNDWRNRNRIKTAQGPAWLTIPVGTDIGRRICDVKLPNDSHWVNKHLSTLYQSYARAPYLDEQMAWFEPILSSREYSTLSELNQAIIIKIAQNILGVRTQFKDSRQYRLEGKRDTRLLNLLKLEKAGQYISGPAAKAYLNENEFAEQGISVKWKSYNGYPEYLQTHPPFERCVTILDLLFHTGPVAPWFIWGWREDKNLESPDKLKNERVIERIAS